MTTLTSQNVKKCIIQSGRKKLTLVNLYYNNYWNRNNSFGIAINHYNIIYSIE